MTTLIYQLFYPALFFPLLPLKWFSSRLNPSSTK